MPLRRRFWALIATVAMLACWATLPSAAHALSVPDPVDAVVDTVEPVVAQTPAPVRETAQQAVESVQPASRPIGSSHSEAPAHPVADTIAPIAHSAAATVPQPAAAAIPQKRLDEHARPRVSHVGAVSSAQRMSSGRGAHGHALDGATAQPSSSPGAAAHRALPTTTETASAPAASTSGAATAPAGMDSVPASGAPAAAASGGAGGSFFFGGGFALLVASLVLAGPSLRRALSLLPAVCRPVALFTVLERPG